MKNVYFVEMKQKSKVWKTHRN